MSQFRVKGSAVRLIAAGAQLRLLEAVQVLGEQLAVEVELVLWVRSRRQSQSGVHERESGW